RHGANHIRQTGDQFVHHGRLVVFLVGFRLDVHGLGFRFTFLEDDVGFRFTLHADGVRAAFSFSNQALLFSFSQVEHALFFNFLLLQHGSDQLILVARNFSFLHFGLLLALNELDLYLLSDDLLLLDVLLDLICLVGLSLLLFDHLGVFGSFHFQITRCFCLFGLRKCLCQHTFLIGLGAGDGGCALRFGFFDSRVAFSFGGGNVGIALDAGDVRAAHVGDVLVLIANFLDGERDHFQAHLAHIGGAGGAHAVADHLRLFYNLLHRELADDAAQMTFHHQADQPFTLLRSLGEELLGRGLDGDFVRFDLELSHGFHADRDTLPGVEVLLRRHVEAHQL